MERSMVRGRRRSSSREGGRCELLKTSPSPMEPQRYVEPVG